MTNIDKMETWELENEFEDLLKTPEKTSEHKHRYRAIIKELNDRGNMRKTRFKDVEELRNALSDIHDHELEKKSNSEILTIRLLWTLSDKSAWKVYHAGGLYELLDPIIDKIT